jgi:hypothetical protein
LLLCVNKRWQSSGGETGEGDFGMREAVSFKKPTT